MGNCQAIDAATLVIQHPSGKVDKLYWPVTASEIMRMNPGLCVALLITTTVYHPTTTTNIKISTIPKNDSKNYNNDNMTSNGSTVRVTRVKLLRPTDNLALGNVYRLISTQEVKKGMVAKKQAKMRKDGVKVEGTEVAVKDAERLARRSQLDSNKQGGKHGQQNQSRMGAGTTNSGTGRARTWQPSLRSISEAGS
ncbi:hypothetical protein Dimus_023837 [Dionaea muscipula]